MIDNYPRPATAEEAAAFAAGQRIPRSVWVRADNGDAIVTCMKCGDPFRVEASLIGPDGTVQASPISCPNPDAEDYDGHRSGQPCGYQMDLLRFLGWDGQPIP